MLWNFLFYTIKYFYFSNMSRAKTENYWFLCFAVHCCERWYLVGISPGMRTFLINSNLPCPSVPFNIQYFEYRVSWLKVLSGGRCAEWRPLGTPKPRPPPGSRVQPREGGRFPLQQHLAWGGEAAQVLIEVSHCFTAGEIEIRRKK